MASSRRQRAVTDPAPANGSSGAATFGLGGGLGNGVGSSTGFPMVFSSATVAGNTLLAYQEIAALGGARVQALTDTVGNTYTSRQTLLNVTNGLGCAAYTCTNAAAIGNGVRGVATGGSTTTIADSTQTWTTNQWAGRNVCNYSTSATIGTVTSNTATTLTISWSQSCSAGNYYVVGDWINFQYTQNDDYWGGFVDEIQGVIAGSGAYIDSSSAQGSFSAGTNNLSPGSKAFGSAPCYLWGVCANDVDGGSTPWVPTVGTGTGDGNLLSFDLGQPILTTSHLNSSSPGTTDLKFSAQHADHFQMILIGLADAGGTPAPPPQAYVMRPGPGLMEPFNPNQFRPTQFAAVTPGPQFLMASNGQAVASGSASLSSLDLIQASGGAVASGTAQLVTLAGSGGLGYIRTPGPGISPSLRDMFRPLQFSTSPAFQTLVAAANGQSIATGTVDLETVISLAVNGTANATGSVDLSTGIQPAASGQAIASASAALSVSAQFNASSSAKATGQADLITGIELAANAGAIASGSASLQGMSLSVNGQAIANATSALTTGLLVAAQAFAKATGTADLQTAMSYHANGVAVTSASVLLLTGTLLQAAGSAAAQGTSALDAGILCVAFGVAPAQASSNLQTGLTMAASAQAICSASAVLAVFPSPLQANGRAVASARAQMTFGTDLAAAGTAVARGTCTLVTILQPPGEFADIRWLRAPRGRLPAYREFLQGRAEVLWYGVVWEDWLASRWEPNAQAELGQAIRPGVPCGFELVCTTAGQTADVEPECPAYQGGVVSDGGAMWTALAVSAASLDDTITDVSASAPAGITLDSVQVQDLRSYLIIDTTAAASGTNYPVLVTIDTAGGQQKTAKILIKVR